MKTLARNQATIIRLMIKTLFGVILFTGLTNAVHSPGRSIRLEETVAHTAPLKGWPSKWKYKAWKVPKDTKLTKKQQNDWKQEDKWYLDELQRHLNDAKEYLGGIKADSAFFNKMGRNRFVAIAVKKQRSRLSTDLYVYSPSGVEHLVGWMKRQKRAMKFKYIYKHDRQKDIFLDSAKLPKGLPATLVTVGSKPSEVFITGLTTVKGPCGTFDQYLILQKSAPLKEGKFGVILLADTKAKKES